MKFKIILPERNENPEEVLARNRRKLKEDFEKGGILTKVFVFLCMIEPSVTSDVVDKLSKYYNQEFDRVRVFRDLDRLVRLGLVYKASSGYVLAIPEGERKEIHRKIVDKFRHFLSNQPPQFHARYTNVNYFWVSNGEGQKYIEWCCKLLNFKCEKE